MTAVVAFSWNCAKNVFRSDYNFYNGFRPLLFASVPMKIPSLSRTLVPLSLGLLSALTARAENVFIVGIDSRCLYGLVACWPEVREPLTKVPGFKSVSQRVDPTAWTCEVRTRDGRAPDFAKIEQTLRAGIGEQFSLRGIEAKVSGTMRKSGNDFIVRLSGSGQVLKLAGLTRKVQWDPHLKADHAITDAERGAFDALRGRWRGKARTVQLTGPLRAAQPGEAYPTLEVRTFVAK